MVYIIDDVSGILLGIGISNDIYISINCGGGPYYYTRSGSDITVSVSNNQITNIAFQNTGIKDIDDLYSNVNFRSWYQDLLEDNKP